MIGMKRKYKTRDGRNVRLLCTDGPGESHPVIGIIDNDLVYFWKLNGMYANKELGMDLIEVSNTRKQTFYRRKWVIAFGNRLLTNLEWRTSKEEFDIYYDVGKDSSKWADLWSDEWEEITVEIKV